MRSESSERKPVTAIVYNTGWYIYNFRRRLIAELQRRNHRVVAICPYDHYVDKLKEMGVEYRKLKLSPLGTNPLMEVLSLIDLFRILLFLRADFVLSFTIKCNLYTGLCRRLIGFRQIANVSGLGQAFERTDWVHRVVCLLYRFALEGAGKVFFQNREDLKTCVNQGLVHGDMSEVLPGSGVDVDRFKPYPRLETDEACRRFLIFGRLLPQKGFDDYILAARRLKEHYGDVAEFLVLGAEDPDRPESRSLRSRIDDAQKNKTISFHHFTDDVRPILGRVDVVVLPSCYNEGVPRSLLEALACGKPIITTDWKGCRETVQPGRNGFLVPVGDIGALAHAMEQLVLAPPSLLAAMGEESRRIAETEFDERYVIDSYVREMEIRKAA